MKLTSEQNKALKVLENMLEQWRDLLNQPINNCTYTNFFGFSLVPIRREHLPHEEHWVWNQSNAKLTTTIFDRVSVTIQKFNARKKPKFGIRQPSYKVWIFTIENFISEPLFAIWCEKGKQVGQDPPLVHHHQQSESTTIQPEELKLESFDFLREFVSEENAIEFGWIKPTENTVIEPNTHTVPSNFILPQQNVIPPPSPNVFMGSFTHYSQEYYKNS